MTADAGPAAAPTSVLLLEDVGSARELYTRWLEGEGFAVTPLRSLDALEREALRVQPDVALIDIQLQRKDDITGFGAAAIIRRVSPDTAIAVFTSYGDDVLKEHLPRVLGNTEELLPDEIFDGVLLKNMSTDEIADGIRQLCTKAAFIAPEAIKYARPRATLLNVREIECIKGLCNGLNHTDLEHQLHLSAKTVHRALVSAKEKLGVMGGDAELVREAYRRRIITGEPA